MAYWSSRQKLNRNDVLAIQLGWCTAIVLCLMFQASTHARVIEAERHATGNGKVYRDDNASKGRCVLGRLPAAQSAVICRVSHRELPAGDVAVTFWVRAQPIDLLHSLDITLQAGKASRSVDAFQFQPGSAFQPFELRLVHAGGPLRCSVSISGDTGFNGMRLSKTGSRGESAVKPGAIDRDALRDDGATDDLDDFSLEEDSHVSTLLADDLCVLVDRIEIKSLNTPPAIVSEVDVQKIHYLPGQAAKASAVLKASSAGTYQFRAALMAELDFAQQVFEQAVQLSVGETKKVDFSFKLDATREFGHVLHCSLSRAGKEVHYNEAIFGVSKNVYRVGVTASVGVQGTRGLTPELAESFMATAKNSYANYYERFAWAPCDYSDLNPKEEEFWSGQTQYYSTRTATRLMIETGHKYGIKAITYGKACAAGIAGYETFLRRPELFAYRESHGPAAEGFNTFFLELAYRRQHDIGEILKDVEATPAFWQHWASLWVRFDHGPTVDFGADAIIESAKVFGWDGVRWDGHFIGNMARFKERVNAKLPNFVHGYNHAFADPGGQFSGKEQRIFLPTGGDVEDFHEIAASHGLIMDESVRDWSNTNFSSGDMLLFYQAIAREADYVKRVGGLPLFITFDMGTEQDKTFNVLCGLAAGQRYTYMTSPGDFAFGTLPRFLTRYSAFIWDDTARLQSPRDVISVSVPDTPPDAIPWWDQTVWLRKLPDGRQQLLINLLNPPGYRAFCNRAQTPPTRLENVTISIKQPDGARLKGAMHLSPDLVNGHAPLLPRRVDGSDSVTLPELNRWSIVVLEYTASDSKPLFELTRPVQLAADFLAEQSRREEQAKEGAKKAADAGTSPNNSAQEKAEQVPSYRDYDNQYNADESKRSVIDESPPAAIYRDGMLDVNHARGPFAWLNPVPSATAILGGVCRNSYVDYRDWRARRSGKGSMDDFPDRYEQLFNYDVLVLDNLHAWDLAPTRRLKIADYVKAGGGLLVLGGYFNFSMGADHNTALAELQPVRIRKYADMKQGGAAQPLQATDIRFFESSIDWSNAGHVLTVETSPLKEGVKVLAKAGDHPAIVSRTVGKGRVIAILINPHGGYTTDVQPYWQNPAWIQILTACLRWLGGPYETMTPGNRAKTPLDPDHVSPDDLMLEAFDLSADEFTKQLTSAVNNMVDAETSRILLETALNNVEKITDQKLLETITERAAPYLDDSFVPLAEKLISAQSPFLRRAAYQILGAAGTSAHRLKITKGLREKDELSVRASLIALGRLGDPAALKAVRALEPTPNNRLLIISVRKRLGDSKALGDMLQTYVDQAWRRTALKCARITLFESLHGGVSFKLTQAQRRKLRHQVRRVRLQEQQAADDLAHFAQSMSKLSDDELATFVAFLRQTDRHEIIPLAHGVFAGMPEEMATRARQQLRDAKLADIRIMQD